MSLASLLPGCGEIAGQIASNVGSQAATEVVGGDAIRSAAVDLYTETPAETRARGAQDTMTLEAAFTPAVRCASRALDGITKPFNFINAWRPSGSGRSASFIGDVRTGGSGYVIDMAAKGDRQTTVTIYLAENILDHREAVLASFRAALSRCARLSP